MNKLIFLAAIVFCLTISCSNPNQPDNSDNAINQIVIANDSNKNIKNKNMSTQKITPYLWVEKDAKAVADYYLSIFKGGKLKDFRKFDSDESGNDAGIETAVIEIAGMEFSILAAGPLFKFNEAVSFVINTKDQAERIIIGKLLLKMVVRKAFVDGVKTNMDYHGRLYQLNILN